jgi:tetratricopeptide (TPR) repeat protein
VSPTAREVLTIAAIVGRSVPRWLLLKVAGALGQEHRSMIEALEVTEQARLLVEAGKEGYRFPHDLIREVVLADLSAARGASLHQLVAEALEQGLGEAPVEQLAYHYSRAGKAEQAIRYLERAAERAQARYAHSEAEGYYQQLIEQLEALGRQAEAAVARERLGVVLLTAARYEQALEILEQVVAGYQVRADREGMARATAHIGRVHALHGSFVEGIARVQPLLEGAIPETLSAQGLAYLSDALAQLFQRSACYSEQLAAAERACIYAQQAQDTQLLARAKASYGLALAYLDRKDEAIAWLEAALSLLHVSDLQNYAAKARASTPQIEHSHLLPEMLYLLAMHAWLDGDWDQSLAHLELARSLLDQATNAWILAQVLVGLSVVKLFRGQVGGAHDLEEAHRLIEHPFIEQWIAIILSECELVRGEAAAASARLEPLLEEPDVFTDYVLIGMGWAALKSDPGKAAALIEQGITFARSSQSQRGLTDGLRIQALLAMQQRQWQAAEQALEEALQVSRSIPFPYGEAKALYVHGLLHQAKGEPKLAHERLEAALLILNRLGERLYAEQVERALTTVP